MNGLTRAANAPPPHLFLIVAAEQLEGSSGAPRRCATPQARPLRFTFRQRFAVIVRVRMGQPTVVVRSSGAGLTK